MLEGSMQRSEDNPIEIQKSSQPNDTRFKSQAKKPVVSDQVGYEKVCVGKGLVANTENEQPGVIREEGDETVPGFPSSARRKAGVTPKLQKVSQSPLKKIRHDLW